MMHLIRVTVGVQLCKQLDSSSDTTQLQADVEELKLCSQLAAGVIKDRQLSVAAYSALQLDRGLTLFACELNRVACPLLTTPKVIVTAKEAVQWCTLLLNEPKDKTIKNSAVAHKEMTQQEVISCARELVSNLF